MERLFIKHSILKAKFKLSAEEDSISSIPLQKYESEIRLFGFV